MKTLKVEYRVKANKLTKMMQVIQEFINAAQADDHVSLYRGYQYKTDPARFVHLMEFTSQENEQAHSNSNYTKKFVEVLYPNCEVQPKFEELIEQ
jgi:quinol monooxygenase YgiN